MQPRAGDFAEVYRAADPIPGWLTEAQARVLHDCAAAVPPGGTVLEIGSHHGRSTVVLARSVGPRVRVVAVDPFPPHWRYGGPGTEATCRANLRAAGVEEVVDLRVATSHEVRAGWQSTLDLVYIDGKHDYLSTRADLRWAEHLRPGSKLLLHDTYSSLGVTTAVLLTGLLSRRLRYVDRVGSLARFAAAPPSTLDRLRLLAGVPWWLRNLVVKVLLRLRLRPLARLLGHHDGADPY